MKRFFVLALLVVATVSPRAFAQGGYLYSLNPSGTVSVNANKINSLTGSFDPDTPLENLDDAWRDIALDGGNVYALRGDGLVVYNGEKKWTLPFVSSSPWFWADIAFTNGIVYALRQDGKLAVSNAIVSTLPVESFSFSALQVFNGATYALRSDGAIFKNSSSTPLFNFNAGQGLNGSGDGQEVDTQWKALKVSPAGDALYALRSDGKLYRGLLPAGNTAGELVDGFPFPSRIVDFNQGDLYWDFEFDDVTGKWLVLRLNGKVYREPDALVDVEDFPANGNSAANAYVDLAVFQGQYFALRTDGQVYIQGNSTTPLLVLSGRDYGRIELSATPPALVGQKNNKPSVVQYTITSNTGGLPVTIPVIATDVETPTADLTVTPVSQPTGSTWDAATRTLTWITPALSGSATFSYSVDDGSGSAKTYTSKIKIKDPDLTPEKNKGPYVPKLKGAVALVGHECRLYLPVGDPDNDPVTVTVDAQSYPFNVGAVYLPVTSEFVWTPANADIGKQTVQFTFSDGIATSTLKLKLEVKSPLFIPPPL